MVVGGLLVVCVATMAAGCAVNPLSGRSEAAMLSADKESELGAEEAKKVEASMGLVADPALVAYVYVLRDPAARPWGLHRRPWSRGAGRPGSVGPGRGSPTSG